MEKCWGLGKKMSSYPQVFELSTINSHKNPQPGIGYEQEYLPKKTEIKAGIMQIYTLPTTTTTNKI